ncbi:L,D-transpeptidase family protein [Nocardioides lijunqiniae]|uniref:L,D-transpeptidase family protein n=1 Tax=Nocardioides lijunqiniae TaxID=2760832 RepID=UPI001878FC98
MSKHRAPVRPRYGRMAILGSSLAVTLIAVLGGTGVLPSTADDTPRDVASDLAGAARDTSTTPSESPSPSTLEEPDAVSAPAGNASGAAGAEKSTGGTAAAEQERKQALRREKALPARSGDGRRVVFSEGRQRVWLVDGDDEVVRTYLVSGSAYDNLDPGTYEVYSRSEDAVGIDDSGTMKYFVRFTEGDAGAAIGFHDIPVDDGKRVQTFEQLGTPLSHGCIRQRRSDAIRLWEFAPLGTTVVVTA